jgi:predicted flap endonuclease-1-like 5' DNA nuclease
MDNLTVAKKLVDYANYVEGEEPNVYRVRAYRRAAETVMALERPLSALVEAEGRAGLEALEGIGPSLAYTIEGLVRTGEFRTLRPDGGHIDPERLLTSLPGVGPHLARALHDRLGITTLEELERAAHEGKLAAVGIGPKRLRGLIDSLAGRLARYRLPEPAVGEPPVEDLLAVDADYRRGAGEDRLPTVAPRRFNPEHEPWLPLYQADRNGWRFRALFSNTALAHRLGQTHDWVVIRFDDGLVSGQRTVVTETRGDLRGRRVVRGRERESRAYYERRGELALPAAAAPKAS